MTPRLNGIPLTAVYEMEGRIRRLETESPSRLDHSNLGSQVLIVRSRLGKDKNLLNSEFI
jgi:hypothetical protein